MKRFLLLLTMLALPVAAHADVYKWRDSNGAVRYSDIPPASNVPYETLHGGRKTPNTPSADVVPAPQPTNPPVPQPDDAALRRQQQAEQEKIEQQNKDSQEQTRQQNCSTARANLQKYKVGGRIMTMDAEGQRRYLSDAEIGQGLEQAQKEVADFCDE
ncbi:MAG TPA: DUF4124 domain-containing protein [Methylophilaceae bacterium]|nr:DUF4124 domain-containing protein [Methylophilaceae bacterium]